MPLRQIAGKRRLGAKIKRACWLTWRIRLEPVVTRSTYEPQRLAEGRVGTSAQSSDVWSRPAVRLASHVMPGRTLGPQERAPGSGSRESTPVGGNAKKACAEGSAHR